MNFEYFCNSTNWNKKLYMKILDSVRDQIIVTDTANR